MKETSELKEMLLGLSDREIFALLSAGNISKSKEYANTNTREGRWFDKNICGLSKEGMNHLKEIEMQMDSPASAHHVDRKQLRYLRAFKKMKLTVPDFFREDIDAKKLFNRLVLFCKEHDIPDEVVCRVVPTLVTYIESGHMRPIIFVGDKGCGKTTAVRMLVEEALKIPTEVIKVPQTDGSHGLTGDCGTYQSADAGYMAKARLKANTLIVAYIFDEIDKVTHERNRASIDDELLSITDESNVDVYDNYLESSLVGLEHCPVFFTANDLKKVNPILVDRCAVVNFPNASASRIKSIAKKYVEEKLQGSLYRRIEFNYDLLNKSIDSLIRHDVTSLRKHQQVIEEVLQIALNIVFIQDSDLPVAVTDDMFTKAVEDIIGSVGRTIGFCL